MKDLSTLFSVLGDRGKRRSRTAGSVTQHRRGRGGGGWGAESQKYVWAIDQACSVKNTLVPEAFIYSLQRNFATQTAFIIFVIGIFVSGESAESLWSRPLRILLSCHQLLTVDIFNCSTSDMIGSVNKL